MDKRNGNEIAIGETFSICGERFKCVASARLCDDCAFKPKSFRAAPEKPCDKLVCAWLYRSDKTDVCFRSVSK